MKIHKPSYNASAKVYTCEITDGFRLNITIEDNHSNIESIKKELIPDLSTTIIESTKGWFSNPLTDIWLKSRINFTIPTHDIPSDFEGTIEYIAKGLVISKEEFMFECSILNMNRAEKIIIDFHEDLEPDLPLVSTDPMGIGPTRRAIQKKLVMKTRAKAARALFHAERLTHEYAQLYGENTDWEDDDSDEE